VIPQATITATLLTFFLLVAPGIVFQIRRERRRPYVERTAFREASIVALASFVLSGLSLLLLIGLRMLAPDLMPDPGAWLQDGSAYVKGHYQVVAGFLFAQGFLAIGLALLVEEVTGREQVPSIHEVSAWYRLFHEQVPPGTRPFVGVGLTDGSMYFGYVAGYSVEHQPAVRELELGGDALFHQRPDASLRELPSHWERVLIPSSSIRSLWVSYLQLPLPDDDRQDRHEEGVEPTSPALNDRRLASQEAVRDGR
jgi:hypothetical protein